MPVKFFIGRDSSGKGWLPDRKHEADSVLILAKLLWLSFNHLPHYFAIVSNLHQPSADYVILTERGMGVVELKGFSGKFSYKGQTWFKNDKPFNTGSHGQFQNPYLQAQSYMEVLREKLIHPATGENPWLPGTQDEWETSYKFQSAVCFTNKDADISGLLNGFRPTRKKWETKESSLFLIKTNELPSWVSTLRFQAYQGKDANFEPYLLTPNQIDRIVDEVLNAKDDAETHSLMPDGDPFGFLIRTENDNVLDLFALFDDEVFIGRDPKKCRIVIPQQFTRSSRVHAILSRTGQGVSIEDLSLNGIYVDGQQIGKQQQLRIYPGQKITLGGSRSNSKVYQFEYCPRNELDSDITTEFAESTSRKGNETF